MLWSLQLLFTEESSKEVLIEDAPGYGGEASTIMISVK
jgi:hypothetical protein